MVATHRYLRFDHLEVELIEKALMSMYRRKLSLVESAKWDLDDSERVLLIKSAEAYVDLRYDIAEGNKDT